MSVYKAKEKRKDGRCWKFNGRYKGLDGKVHYFKGANYHTRKEVEKAYQERLKSINEMFEEKYVNDLTMIELTQGFVKYQKVHENVRSDSFENYYYKLKSFENISNVKVMDFNDNIKHYEKWKQWVNAKRKNSGEPLKASAKNESVVCNAMVSKRRSIKQIYLGLQRGNSSKFTGL